MPEIFESGGGKARTLPEGSEIRGTVAEMRKVETRYGERSVLGFRPDGSDAKADPVEYWFPKTLAHQAAGSRIRMMRTAARHYVLEVYKENEKFPKPAFKVDTNE